METSYIRTMSNFPNFSQNAANFPNSMGPCPIPKKGCESPGLNTKKPVFGTVCKSTRLGVSPIYRVKGLWHILCSTSGFKLGPDSREK